MQALFVQQLPLSYIQVFCGKALAFLPENVIIKASVAYFLS